MAEPETTALAQSDVQETVRTIADALLRDRYFASLLEIRSDDEIIRDAGSYFAEMTMDHIGIPRPEPKPRLLDRVVSFLGRSS